MFFFTGAALGLTTRQIPGFLRCFRLLNIIPIFFLQFMIQHDKKFVGNNFVFI